MFLELTREKWNWYKSGNWQIVKNNQGSKGCCLVTKIFWEGKSDGYSMLNNCLYFQRLWFNATSLPLQPSPHYFTEDADDLSKEQEEYSDLETSEI